MAQKNSINATQLQVLRWVGEGCPDGVMSGHGFKVSAKALEWRGLMTISTRGGEWRAELTDDGRYYVEHGRFRPEPPMSKRGSRGRSRAPHKAGKPAAAKVDPIARPAAETTTVTAELKSTPTMSPVDKFVADLVAQHGTMQVNGSAPRGHDYEKLARSAMRYGKVPPGKVLAIEDRPGWGNCTIRLQDRPPWMTGEHDSILVPDRTHDLHPVVVQLRDDERRLSMTELVRARALRVLNMLAVAAEAKGYQVAVGTVRDRRIYPRGYVVEGDVRIEIMGHAFEVVMVEPTDRVPHQATAAELLEAERRSWVKIPKYDQTPSGRLCLSIPTGWPYSQSNWTYRKDAPIDVAPVLRELELRADHDEQLRLENERKEAERQRRWEQALAVAKAAYAEDYRAKVLLNQQKRWRRGLELDEFLVAMREHVDGIGDEEEATQAQRWLDWVIAYRASLDPFLAAVRMPTVPEPDRKTLEPYLGSWAAEASRMTAEW